MALPVPPNESDAQPQISFLISLSALKQFFTWLASLVELTEAEQEQAGLYLGGEGRD